MKKKFTRFLHLKSRKIFNSPIVWIILSYLKFFSFSLLYSSFFKEFFFCVQKLLFLPLFSLPKYTMLLCALNPLHIPPHTCFVVDLFFLKTAFFRIPFCVKVLKILKNSHTKKNQFINSDLD